MHTSVPRGPNVERGVSNHPGLAQVEIEVLFRLQHHPWLWFAAIALDLQFGHFAMMPAIGVMRTVVDSIKPRATSREQHFEFGMDPLDSGFIAFATRHHGLIGDQDGAIPGSVDHGYGLNRAFDQLQIARRYHTLHFHVQGAVTIQKDGRLWRTKETGDACNRMDIGQFGVRQSCFEYSQWVFRGYRYYGS